MNGGKSHGMAYFTRSAAKALDGFVCGVLPQEGKEDFSVIFIERASFSVSFIL